MWRAVFLAIGITLCVVGAECLFIERAVLAKPLRPKKPENALQAIVKPFDNKPRELVTEEWMPWSFMSAGAVIILYTWTLPKRFG